MKNILTLLLCLFCVQFSFSQEGELCVDINSVDPAGYPLIDYVPGYLPGTALFTSTNCYRIENDILYIYPNPECCGLNLVIFEADGPQGVDTIEFEYTLKCEDPKPPCNNINLSEIDPTDSTTPKVNVYGCENTPINYYIDPAPGQTITWDAGPVPVNQGPPNEATITWPAEGSYSLTVTVGGVATTYCIEIVDAPEADFIINGGCGCLNSDVSFISTGIGGNQFYWDFGDGAYGTGMMANHTYTTPGIYDVTLVVVQENASPQGEDPLCCCTDTITMPLTIEPLEGPNIYWVSTLCEGDTTKYWTDAQDCAYTWAAEDANGNSVLPFGTDITNDTLCVVWGSGPYGTVSLTVSGCSDGPYCAKPSTVTVPIIESNSTISGKDTVCSLSTGFYEVPKWHTVTYDWEIIPASAGSIISGQGTNAINIAWGTGPASATIVVNYGSDFLGGIFGHEPSDCQGSATFDVDILPEFGLDQPLESIYCVNETFTIEANDVGPTTINPVNGWTYEIRPPSGPTVTVTGVTIPYSTSLAVGGIYTIAAYPDYPNPYCNDTVFQRIEIIDYPLVDSIVGRDVVCPGDVETYFGFPSDPGAQLDWSVLNGSFVGPSIGDPVTVMWGASGPYSISVRQIQQVEPKCTSDYITLPVTEKFTPPPIDIIGSDGCVNKVQSYSASPLPADPDVIVSWSISPAGRGSIIAGETTPYIDVQWNNVPGPASLTVNYELCGNIYSYTKSFNLLQAAPVTISQNMPYCVGSSTTTLTASTPSATYVWDTPSGSPTPGPQTIGISESGVFVVTVTETSGCTAVASYEVYEIAGPPANLTSPDILSLCTSNVGEVVELHGLDGAYTFTWYKSTNGGTFMVQPTPTDPAVFEHTNTGAVGYCDYYYVVTNSAGCETTSNTVRVNQSLCTGSGTGTGGCDPEFYMSDLTYTPSMFCNEVTFMPNITPNVTITGWDFNDPLNIAPTGPGPMFTYSEAGYYIAYMYGTVPDQDTGLPCAISDTTAVCVPLAADFSYTYNCGVYTFTNTSSYISGEAPTIFDWDYGDTNSGSGPVVSHGYTSYGPTMVTLTIENPAGCKSQITKTINVTPPPTANIVVMPPDTCVNKPFMFSNLDDTGIMAWNWQFGDGSANNDPAPGHAYVTDGTYMVTLTVTDINGCTGSNVRSVTVHPAPIPGPITYMDDLFICPGESLLLNAPAGSSFLWNDNSTGSTLSVNAAGIYGVTVTDMNGCSFVPDSVEVIMYPPIDTTITGNPVICDDGCTTLYAVSKAGYVYQWTDQSNVVLTPNSPPSSIDLCFSDGVTTLSLEITDANGCTATNSVNIQYYNSPDATIISSDPDLCAGKPITLTATTTYPDSVIYNWSTGSTSDSIVVGLEGTYYVTITDPLTGCSGVDFIIINPLPDLCLVPRGCYTTCEPDTLCAPSGLTLYKWYFNGVEIPGTMGMPCITVTESGAYNFEGTNSFGCSDVSDTLYLEMVPCCRPGDTEISAVPFDGEIPCCYTFDYTLHQDIFFRMDMYSPHAGLDMDVSSVDPALAVLSNILSLNSFGNAIPTMPLPQGPINNFVTICLDNPIVDPVTVYVDYIGEDGEVLCMDSLLLTCPVEPDCIYIANDTLYCGPNGNYLYDVTICNPADAAYPIGYIDFVEVAPFGVTMVPSSFDLTGNELLPGVCTTFTAISINGSGLANQTLKFNLIGHEMNPFDFPETECCSLDSLHCAFIPGCTDCEMVYISSVDSSDIGDCCYDVTMNNYYDDMSIGNVDLCVITTGATFSLSNPFGSPWTINSPTPTTVNLGYNDGTSSFLPYGDTQLPTICIGDSDTPLVQIEVKWVTVTGELCRDTIDLLCGDCGYMEADIVCNSDGSWILTGYITNTSSVDMANAFIDLGDPALDPYDIAVNFGTLMPGQTFGPFTIVIPIPAGGPSELCIETTMHAVSDDNLHEECCQFKTVLKTPDCDQDEGCLCDADFENQVDLGFTCNPWEGIFEFQFMPIGNLTDCDRVIWNWVDEQESNYTIGNQSIVHTFPGFGEYKVCMIVIRTQPDGTQCKHEYCKTVNVYPHSDLLTYPNPSTDKIYVGIDNLEDIIQADILLFNTKNILVLEEERTMEKGQPVELNINHLTPGLYFMKVVIGDEVMSKKIMVVH